MVRQYGGVGSGFLGVQVDAADEDRMGAVAEDQDDEAGGVGQQIAPNFVICVMRIMTNNGQISAIKRPVVLRRCRCNLLAEGSSTWK